MKYKVGDRFSGINGHDEPFTGEIVEINSTVMGGPYLVTWSDVACGGSPISFRERELDHIIGTEKIRYLPAPSPLPEDLFTI